jgi:hypothetical protein
MLRAKVRAMAGYGLPQPDIARLIDTDPETLRKHYRADLDTGKAEADLAVTQSLHLLATKGKNPASAIYWTKARMGWTDNAVQRDLELKLLAMQQEIAALRAEKAT